MPELKLNDVSLNYEVDDFTDPWLKKRETVLLHHGCGRNLGFWYRWVPILARRYKVVRIDARGFGKSSDPGPGFKWSIEAFANDVIALLDHLEIAQIYFVGEHMGCFTGTQLALQYPQRIKKLVISSFPYFGQGLGGVGSMVNRIDTTGIRSYVLSDERLRFGGNKVYGSWFADEYAKSRANTVKSVMQAASGVDYRNRLSDIKCPVLVLLGELFVKQCDGEGKTRALLREKLPKSSEIVVIEGAPWFVIYTRSVLCARLCMKFFEKQD